jgi:hypothetical protein
MYNLLKMKINNIRNQSHRSRDHIKEEWGSPTIFTLIGGACVLSVITFGTPRLA